MIQRKLSLQRVHADIEIEGGQIPEDNEQGMPVKINRKISKGDKEDSHEESKAVNKDEARDMTQDNEMADGDINGLEEVQSPQELVEQDSPSKTAAGVDDSPQEVNGGSKRLRMYKCERCNSQYMGLAMLRQHCRDVHGDQKYYKCHVCGKLFSHPSSRNIHLRLHSGEKPYKCSTCGKQFRVSSHLKDHVRVHTGERPYICDICHKGFKQSSDLKKHRRTHTLDKPYKCPICPSAFTRSHHCRGHMNSVHKFFKCVVCSALFTSEEAFEQHKELHPSEQADPEQRAPSNRQAISQAAVLSKTSESTVNTSERDSIEKNLKLDAANQLLELHKMMQPRPLPSSTPGSGSETLSDSGDEASLRQLSPPSQGLPVGPQPPVAVSPSLIRQEVANMSLSSAGHKDQANVILPEMAHKGANSEAPPSLHMMYSHSVQPKIQQEKDYLRLPFQYSCYEGNKKLSLPNAEMYGHAASFSSLEVQTSQLVNGNHFVVNGASQNFMHSPEKFDSQSQRRDHSNLSENSLKREEFLQDDSVLRKSPERMNNVACHRVSVIQYHSSAQKSPTGERNEENMIKDISQEASEALKSEMCDDHLRSKEEQFRSYNFMNSMKYFAKIPREGIPYLPLTAESTAALQMWNKEINDHAVDYSWALKEATRLKMLSEQSGQLPPPKHILENGQRNFFSPEKVQLSANMHNSASSPLQERSVEMLKYLAREHTKVKDMEGETRKETKSPVGGNDSETSDTSDSGSVLQHRKVSASSDPQSLASEPLDQRSSPESAIHHCQVCKKTFSRSSLLKQHSVIHMGNKRFKFRCEVCGKMFRTRSHLRDHTRIHTGERPFKCHICEKAFKQSSDLKKHINLHTGANQFKCEECNMEFRRADALRKHKLGHKVGNMPCGHCGKNFLHINALRVHRAMHNVQPVKASRSFHRCNYCFKTFTKAESYKIHIEAHSREQNGTVVPFDCKICSMKFFSEAAFQDHMNIHNGKRPYKCFVCDKEFCIAEHLQDHVRLHSDVSSRHRCEDDGNKFQRPDDLVRHSAIHA